MAAKIPTHVFTEDHIPSVLVASTKAIARGDDPEAVQIVTHVAHLSATDLASLGSGAKSMSSPAPPRPLTPTQILRHSLLEGIGEEKAHHGKRMIFKEPASMGDPLEGSLYGSTLSTNADAKTKRLSFVSFADVVHGEQSGMVPGGYGPGGPSPPSSSGYCSPVTAPRGVMKIPASDASGSGGASPPSAPASAPASPTVFGNLLVEKMSTAMGLAGRESTEI
jgi:hypothetical protein